MSPYCSGHDEWLIMKLCMYVGYHDANNVSHFGGDPIKFKKRFIVSFKLFTGMAPHSCDAVTVSVAVATRSCAGCSSVEGHILDTWVLIFHSNPQVAINTSLHLLLLSSYHVCQVCLSLALMLQYAARWHDSLRRRVFSQSRCEEAW